MLKDIRLSLTSMAVAATMVLPLLSSCDDSANIGSSLVTDSNEVVIANEFKVSGHTVPNPDIQSKTTTLVLGRFKADGYGSFTSEFVTQFMPATALPENITPENVDSIKLQFQVPKGSYVGDTIVPMGLAVYELTKQLPAPIYSNFDPDGYYDPSNMLASKIYACNTIGATDSIKQLGYNLIDVKLPLSLGKRLCQLYIDHPEAYTFPANFAKYFPGIYVNTNFGNGCVVAIQNSAMRLYYHTTSTGSDGAEVNVKQEGAYYAVTPEIILNNTMNYVIDEELQTRIDDGNAIVVAPVGRDVEMEFPINSVIDYYKANSGSLSVVNTLNLDIPVTAIENDYGINPPEHILLVLKSKKEEFFAKNLLNDDVTSFYATYDSANHRYRFSGMRNYLLYVLEKETVTPEDYTFILTPVNIEMESNSSYSYYYGSTSTQYVSAINPYVGAPTVAQLNLDESTVTLTFARQTVN